MGRPRTKPTVEPKDKNRESMQQELYPNQQFLITFKYYENDIKQEQRATSHSTIANT